MNILGATSSNIDHHIQVLASEEPIFAVLRRKKAIARTGLQHGQLGERPKGGSLQAQALMQLPLVDEQTLVQRADVRLVQLSNGTVLAASSRLHQKGRLNVGKEGPQVHPLQVTVPGDVDVKALRKGKKVIR